MTVQAYVLIQTEVGKAAQVASEVRKIDGVKSADDVTGPYDVIVNAEAESVELRMDGAETQVRRPRAGRPGRRAFVSGKRRQNTIKTTTFSDGQGRILLSGVLARSHDPKSIFLNPLPWYAAIALGILGGLLMAALIGVLAIRTRGIYFAMVTMALSQCVYYLFYQAVDWTGGENGLRGINVRVIDIFGIKLNFINPLTRYYVIAAFVIAAFFVLSRILASPFGAVIEAVRENETRAKASGYDATVTRLITFVLSGGFCGLAGALQALHLSIVPIEILHYDTSGVVVMIALLGGMGTFFGPMIGAAAFLLLENLVSVWTVHWQLIVGAVFMICVLFFPAGIWGTLISRGKP